MTIRRRMFLILTAVLLLAALSALADTPTTAESGPITTHTPKTYTWEIGVGYPLPPGNYSNYLQSWGILYPGDTVVIAPEKDDDTSDGYQGSYGIRFLAEPEGTTPVVGTKIGPFEVTEVAVAADYTFIRQVKVLAPAMLQEAGGGDAVKDGTNTYSVRTVRYIELPKYIPVQYVYNLEGKGDVDSVDGELYGHQNPTVIWAEDLCLTWNAETKEYEMIGPCFQIYRPFIEGYSFVGWDYRTDDIPLGIARNDGEEIRENGQKTGKEFYFESWQCAFSTRFDNVKVGDETNTPVKIWMRYAQRYSSPETLALQGNGGTILGYTSRRIDLEPTDGFWGLDAFPKDYIPVQEGKAFTGWYKDKKCTELVASADLSAAEMLSAIKSDYYGRDKDVDGWHYNLYAGWKGSEPAAPTTATVGALKYSLKGGNATVTAPKSKSAKKLTIPATIKVKGKTYKVTAIKASAFKGMAKLTTVTIGANVKTIGKNAFLNCKKLKTITIKTTKLTTKTVGANAFKGVYKKATVKVPAKKLKAYRTLLVKKGLPKTAKVKK